MKENILRGVSGLTCLFLLAYTIMCFINSASKQNDPNRTSLLSGVIYLFAVVTLAYVTFIQ